MNISTLTKSLLAYLFLALLTPSVAISKTGMTLHESPIPIPDIAFLDHNDELHTLIDFKGKFVLLNIWATWCTPCREEMPALDRLQEKMGGDRFTVVALSIDEAGMGVVNAFYTEIGIKNLQRYIDHSGDATLDLSVIGIPTTLLIDPNGNEISRLLGPAEWDDDNMIEFFTKLVKQHFSDD